MLGPSMLLTVSERCFLGGHNYCFVSGWKNDCQTDEILFFGRLQRSDECQQSDTVWVWSRIRKPFNAYPGRVAQASLRREEPITWREN